jgi:hypothetical protein
MSAGAAVAKAAGGTFADYTGCWLPKDQTSGNQLASPVADATVGSVAGVRPERDNIDRSRLHSGQEEQLVEVAADKPAGMARMVVADRDEVHSGH